MLVRPENGENKALQVGRVPRAAQAPAVVGTLYKFKIGNVNNKHPKVSQCLFIMD